MKFSLRLAVRTLLAILSLDSAPCQETTEPWLAELKQNPVTTNHGRFIGRVVAVWLRHYDPKYGAPEMAPWRMCLTSPFEYVDEGERRWLAPSRTPIDGASIPQILWGRLVGSPYTGQFREASVIHDRYCVEKDGRSLNDIHRMFYEAMLCEGCSWREANTKYFAVRALGPQQGGNELENEMPFITSVPLPTDGEEVQAVLRNLNDAERAEKVRALFENLNIKADKDTLYFEIPSNVMKRETGGFGKKQNNAEVLPYEQWPLVPERNAAKQFEFSVRVKRSEVVKTKAFNEALKEVYGNPKLTPDNIDSLATQFRAKSSMK